MLLPEILRQERSGPYRRAIAQVAWISLDDYRDQGVNNPMHYAGTTAAYTGSHALCDLQGLAAVELGDPLVDRLASEAQPISHLLHGVSLV